MNRALLSQSLFLRACRREPTPRPPVWMMRQAGRYLPAYRAVRDKVSFHTLCRDPALATEVTLQPVDELGVDAAVIFSDILVLLEAMGIGVSFEGGSGPRLARAVRSASDAQALRDPDPADNLDYVGEAIRRTTEILTPRETPVIGFAGAPFTLACYAIEGETRRDFPLARQTLAADPAFFSALLDRLADAVAAHLRMQIEAGAAAVQIFDSWGGLLGRDEWRRIVLPSLRRTIASARAAGAPVILYVGGSAPHLEAMSDSGADVLSVDWRLPLDEVRRRVGHGVALQGNLDPTALFAPPATVRAATRQMLAAHPGPGHVANLGHGILPTTPVASARAFIETVKGGRDD
ncbi:MAG: uroporphyrinogen decarboxylase [Verrucomicrobiae bacterium]|nr:uroporphyrinogen decarboxylase [Verrucomicrobiae bacterium]